MEKKVISENELPQHLKDKLEFLLSEQIIIQRYIDRSDWYSVNKYFEYKIKKQDIFWMKFCQIIINKNKGKLPPVTFDNAHKINIFIENYYLKPHNLEHGKQKQ